MSNAFEYGDALLPRPEGAEEDDDTPPQIEPNQPYLSLATFRMVVLADEILESFFETDLSASFRLEPVPLMELPPANNGGFLGGLWSNIATDNNLKLFHKLSDEVGKTIGRHQVIHRPSIGRYTSVEDTRPRESLLTPAMRRSSSKSSLKSAEDKSGSSSAPIVVAETTSRTTTAAGGLLLPSAVADSNLTSPTGLDPLSQATNAVANAFMERTPFAIDDAGDDDDGEDEEEETEQDDVLDEVRSCVAVALFVSFFSFSFLALLSVCVCLFLVLVGGRLPRSSRYWRYGCRQGARERSVNRTPRSRINRSIVFPLPDSIQICAQRSQYETARGNPSPSLVNSAYLDPCHRPRFALADSVDNFPVPPHFHSSSYDFQKNCSMDFSR